MDQGLTCPMCGARVNSDEEMQAHKTMHETSNEGAIKCPMCGATFSTKEEMDKHAKEAHNQSM